MEHIQCLITRFYHLDHRWKGYQQSQDHFRIEYQVAQVEGKIIRLKLDLVDPRMDLQLDLKLEGFRYRRILQGAL